MESEIADEELADLEEAARPAVRRVLDQDTIQEPIRLLNPRTPLCLAPDASLQEAVRVMREHHVGCVLAVENDRLAGILTERDLLLKLEGGDLSRPVREVMTADPEVLRLDDPIVYALHRMSVGGYRHVPLVDDAGRPVGILSVKDIVHYVVSFFVSDVLTLPLDPARSETWRGRDGA
jgi:CBS domain-containing protein